jgi:hypothetical protein
LNSFGLELAQKLEEGFLHTNEEQKVYESTATTTTTTTTTATTTTITKTWNVHSLRIHADNEADPKELSHVTICPHFYLAEKKLSHLFFLHGKCSVTRVARIYSIAFLKFVSNCANVNS